VEHQRETVVVTTAGLSHTDDMKLRQRRYLLTQGVRVACVLLAVLLPVAPIWKIGFIAASLILPWFGVVAANAGPTVQRKRATAVVHTTGHELVQDQPGRIIDAER
jgi:hypothetical protein